MPCSFVVSFKVRIDAEPNLIEALYDCSSAGFGSLESCTLHNVAAGSTLFAVVEAYTDFTDLVLTCSSSAESSVQSAVELTAGLPSEPFGLNTLQIQDFTFATPLKSSATCWLEGDSGDADLFLRWSDPPIIDGRIHQFDCASENEFSAETCSVANPGNATVLWARVFAFQGFDGIVITCAGATPTGNDTTVPIPDTGVEPSVAPTPANDTEAGPSMAPVVEQSPEPTESKPDLTPAPSESVPSTDPPDLVVPTDPASDGTTDPPASAGPTGNSSLPPFGISAALFGVLFMVFVIDLLL